MKMSRFALSDFRLFRLMGAIRQYNVGRWDLGRCCTSCRFSARHRLRRGRRHRRPPRRRRSIVSDGRGVGAGLHKRRRPLVVAVGRTVDGLVRRRGVDFFPRRPPSVDRRRRRRRPHQTLRARPPLAVAVRSDVAPRERCSFSVGALATGPAAVVPTAGVHSRLAEPVAAVRIGTAAGTGAAFQSAHRRDVLRPVTVKRRRRRRRRRSGRVERRRT